MVILSCLEQYPGTNNAMVPITLPVKKGEIWKISAEADDTVNITFRQLGN
jgi:hypothetical protein